MAALTSDENIVIDSYRKCYSLLICQNPTEDCFFLKCKSCPGNQKFIDHLLTIFEKNQIENITVKQWKTDSSDKTTLDTLLYDYDDFASELADKFDKLLGHAYIAEQQSKFSREIELTLKEEEFKVVSDFAENLSYVVQNAIQGFHWNNDQATIYNVVMYYRQNGKVHHRSLVIVSDNRKHDATAVHTFNKIVIEYLRQEFSSVKKIIYFSDGAPQQ